MRRAGKVLEGGESFDSSGFYLAGRDEMLGRLNAMSGWQATSKNKTANPGTAIGSRLKKSSLRLAKRRKILAHPPVSCMTREEVTICRLSILILRRASCLFVQVLSGFHFFSFSFLLWVRQIMRAWEGRRGGVMEVRGRLWSCADCRPCVCAFRVSSTVLPPVPSSFRRAVISAGPAAAAAAVPRKMSL
jgi:hypothetical protein